MIEFLLKHAIELTVFLFVIGNTLYWHKKGFLRLAVSVSFWLLTITIVNLLLPWTSAFISKHTNVEKTIKREILNGITTEYDEDMENDRLKQEEYIEKLKLPKQIKDVLNANNQKQTWQQLGADYFADYIGKSLSKIITTILSFILVFVFVWIILKIAVNLSDIVSKVPIIYGLNQIAGAVGGFIYAIFIVWMVFLFLGVSLSTSWGRDILAAIESSFFLNFLYNMNILSWILRGILFAIWIGLLSALSGFVNITTLLLYEKPTSWLKEEHSDRIKDILPKMDNLYLDIIKYLEA